MALPGPADRRLTLRRPGLRRLLRWLAVGVASALALPLLLLALVVLHLWGTAGELARYAPVEPSRLYAAPVVLQRGAPYSASVLEQTLEALGYRQAAAASAPGELTRDGNQLTLVVRGQGVANGPAELSGARLEVTLASGRITALRVAGIDAGDRAVPLGRPLLFTYHDERLRECWPVELDDLPSHAVAAVLAAEDARFFRHNGLAPVGVARAAWTNLRAGEIRQGGSSITQQLVKNLWLGSQRTFARKAREAALALLVDVRFGKRRILESYLNEAYWGSAGGANLHGIGAAARAYFGKTPAELDLGEAAALAGMIRSPANHSPLTHPQASRARRDQVLRRMATLGAIDAEQAAAAIRRPLEVRPLPTRVRRAPYFARAAAREARERFAVEELAGRGWRLHSTLSYPDQVTAEQEVRVGLRRLEGTWQQGHGGLQAALVSLEPHSGRVLAWVGGRDFERSEFDRVSQARRQAGSAFKPIVYAAAFERGTLAPGELLRDSPILVRFDRTQWRPRNADGRFHGEVTPRQALEQSLNVPTVRVAMRTGLREIRALGREMGINGPLPAVPALALGACEVTALELATVYATLATGGLHTTPWALEAVENASGEPLAGTGVDAGERVLSPETAYLVTAMLRGVVAHGTASSARSLGVDGPLAGKTGTTDDRRDSWFAGYSTDRATVVWVGYDDNAQTRLSGTRGALPLWSRFTARMTPAVGYTTLEAPPGFVTVSLDPATGALAGPFCPRRVQEELPVWRAPLHTCTVHRAAVLVRDQRPAPAARNWRLSDLLLSGDPGGPSPALRGDVTLLFGKGGRIDASASPPLEVSLRPGARPVPVAPAPTARLQLPGDLP